MGYQESHIEVDSLAEASGIIRAIREKEEREWLHVYGAQRSTRDLHYGDPYGFNEGRSLEDCELIPEGELVVTIFGDRKPYQFTSEMRFIDGIMENDTVGYSACFDTIPQTDVDKAAQEDPDTEKQAYEQMKCYLDHIWDGNPWERPEELRYCRVSTVEQAKRDREKAEREFPYLARNRQRKE